MHDCEGRKGGMLREDVAILLILEDVVSLRKKRVGLMMSMGVRVICESGATIRGDGLLDDDDMKKGSLESL